MPYPRNTDAKATAMPYNKTTGLWEPEDDSVSKNLTDVLSQDNPYMKQARASGLATANRRGLLNSSMGAESGESAAIAAALPIAQQNASQTATKNLSGQEFKQTGVLNTGLYAEQEKQQATGLTAQKEQLQMQLDAAQKQYEAQIAAGNQQQANQLAAQMEQLQTQLASQQSIAGQNIASNEKIAALDTASKETIAGLDKDTQLTIANMNVKSNSQDKAMAAAAQYAAIYSQQVSAITANPDIPSDARDYYLQNARAQLDSDMKLVEQMYNIDLDWGDRAPAAAASTGAPGYYNEADNYDQTDKTKSVINTLKDKNSVVESLWNPLAFLNAF